MSVVFFGSSSFSVPILKSIASLVSCVVTKKGKPKGRGYHLEDNEVKRAATTLHLPVVEIESFKDQTVREVEAYKPSLFVVASFGLIVPTWALEIPSAGPVNIHPSLLPKHRGPSPIQWALWSGDSETGITFIRMNEKMDAGNILYQETMAIASDDTILTLSDRLSRRSAEILPGFIQDVLTHGLAEGIPQKHEEATFTPIITKEMGKIDWTRGAMEIERQIRALVAWPTAYTYLDGLLIKIFDAVGQRRDPGDTTLQPGTIMDVRREGVDVWTGTGVLMIREVQLQNRKRMKAYDFAGGYRKLVGKILGKP
ncbi:MAG: Methionyl-tRNA formyltransferase [Syntrophorhabdus sp. PtaU1.Bin153]|nr:MAG: Methionyl-tRNA formyltransferase [Syntrophorhabdus sp. PtaU1.Bin153]